MRSQRFFRNNATLPKEERIKTKALSRKHGPVLGELTVCIFIYYFLHQIIIVFSLWALLETMERGTYEP